MQGGGVTFDFSQAWKDRTVTVACGQCIGCRLERSRRWAMRCLHEASLHKASCFITLTYSDEHLPGDRGLCLDDWQRFMKRLRKNVGKVRFFHCGEYGEITARPHYHACIFGQDFSADRVLFKMTKDGHRLYTSEVLTETWGLGHAIIGDVTFESAAYVARYVMKKVTGDKAESHYGGRRPEYVTMSRNPGLGAGWFEKYGDETFRDDFVVINGKRCRVPKFYDDRFAELHPEEFCRVKARRVAAASQHSEDTTRERLDDRETVQVERVKLLRRSVE